MSAQVPSSVRRIPTKVILDRKDNGWKFRLYAWRDDTNSPGLARSGRARTLNKVLDEITNYCMGFNV